MEPKKEKMKCYGNCMKVVQVEIHKEVIPAKNDREQEVIFYWFICPECQCRNKFMGV